MSLISIKTEIFKLWERKISNHSQQQQSMIQVVQSYMEDSNREYSKSKNSFRDFETVSKYLFSV